jgi:hypothetical protein
MNEQRPRVTYDCETVAAEQAIHTGDGELLMIPPAGIVCRAWTDDNGDSGYVGEHATWIAWAPDRAAFDRIVGVSRRGVLHDVTVILDGEKLERAR